MRTVLLGALALLCAGSANAAIVTGTVNYRDTMTVACPIPATGCAPLQPIAFSRIQIWNRGTNPWDIWWPVGETTTDANGHFFHSDNLASGTFAVRVYATNFAALVQAGSSDFYAEPGFPGPNIQKSVTSANQTIDFSFDFTDPLAARFYNVAETTRRGFDHAAARRDPNDPDALPRATVSVTSFTGNPANLKLVQPGAAPGRPARRRQLLRHAHAARVWALAGSAAELVRVDSVVPRRVRGEGRLRQHHQ